MHPCRLSPALECVRAVLGLPVPRLPLRRRWHGPQCARDFRTGRSRADHRVIASGPAGNGNQHAVSRLMTQPTSGVFSMEDGVGLFSKDIKTMDDMLLHGLQDIYYAEQQIT